MPDDNPLDLAQAALAATDGLDLTRPQDAAEAIDRLREAIRHMLALAPPRAAAAAAGSAAGSASGSAAETRAGPPSGRSGSGSAA